MSDCEKNEDDILIKCQDEKNKDMIIMNLQLRLQFEKFKNKIYTNIIKTQTEIKIEDVIQESETEVNIFNFKNSNIPIVFHDFFDKKEKYVIKQNKTKIDKESSKKSIVVDNIEEDEKQKKKIYRKVPDSIKISEKELNTKLKDVVVEIDKKIDQIVYDNFDVSHKEISETIEKLFDDIVNNKKYISILLSIKNIRKKLFGKITLEEYINLLHSHIKRFEEIFLQRKYSRKKICKNISLSLTPLDMRLCYYDGYTNVNIEIDEVQKFGLVLEILTEHEKQFVCYKKKTFFDNVKNYSLCLFELRDCIKRCLINRYGFQNIIYLDIVKSLKNDPYSFYTLEEVNEKRYWKMECRLEDFSFDFIDNILPYCVSIFRKLYKDVFNDNIYRVDYMNKSIITEYDCEQLIQNIILLAQPMFLCKMFQEIIISNSTFTPTESDKFSLYGDDKFQQKRFGSNKDNEEEICKIIKRLFDNINDEDALHIIRTKGV